MFENGFLITRSTRDRVNKGPLGVRKWKPEKCWNGYNLFSQAFGDTEYLMDMSGRIVHRWSVVHSQYAVLMPDGNLVAGNYGNFVQEIKPDGTEIWRYGASLDRTGEWGGLGLSNPYHHDFDLGREDTIYVLANKQEPVWDEFYERNAEPDYMLTDMVLRIDRSDNEVEWSFSFSDHIEEISNLSGLPLPVPFRRYIGPEEDEEIKDCVEPEPYKDGLLLARSPADWAHANTVEVLPNTPSGEEDERFKEGNILVSFRNLDIIAIIDPDREKVVWTYGLGSLDGQHHSRMLDNGNILLFDNGTYRGHSIVKEIDPLDEEIVWKYKDKDFYSPYRSGVQRLPNENTLICESDAGRIFEVTPHKEIVWDFYTPFLGQGGEVQGQHIYRASRYSKDYIKPVLESREDEVGAVSDEHRKPVEDHSELIDFYREDEYD